jgi:disease resistance protein RPM1
MVSDQWRIIKSAFPRDVSSRIVVTTKIQSVANTCSSANGYIHKMRRLDEKHSKKLFLKNACPGEYSDYLQPDSAAILKKCEKRVGRQDMTVKMCAVRYIFMICKAVTMPWTGCIRC